MIDAGAVQKIVDLLKSSDTGVVEPVFYGVYIASQQGRTKAIDALIEANIVPQLIQMLESANSYVLKHALKTIYNLASHEETQVSLIFYNSQI